MAYQIQLRNDSANNWANVDPVLAQGEPGYENDTGRIKYGTGTAAWSSLPYFTSGGGGNSTPGGPNFSIQYNNSGVFGGSAFFSANPTTNVITVTGNVSADYFIGDGGLLSNIPSANLSSYAGNIIPAANNVYSLGNASNQWNELWVSSNTIYIGGIPLSQSNSNLTFAGNTLVSQSNTGITDVSNLNVSGTANIPDLQSNTIIANFIAGDGSQITNIQYTNIIGAYNDSNVAAYLPVYDGDIGANIATANYFVGDGSLLTNLPVLDAYSNANVAAYLPLYDGDVLANVITANGIYTGSNTTAGSYFMDVNESGISFGEAAAQSIWVGPSGIQIAGTGGVTIAGINLANVTIGNPTGGSVNVINPINLGPIGNVTITGGNAGEILATNGNGTLYWTTDSATYGNANVAAYMPSYLPTYTGDIAFTAANVSGNIDAGNNYIIGNAAFMTGLDYATGYSNANVANFLPVYSGDIDANVITANTISTAYEVISERSTANSIVFGNGVVTVGSQSWTTTQGSGLSNITLYQTAANTISSVDFNITATSGNDRQVAKIMAVTIAGSLNYTEYGSLNVGNNLCNFTVDLQAGNIELVSEPFVANAIDYVVIINGYY